MATDNLNSKIVTATKWSTVTVLASKLVMPISNIILARLLTPDAFGIVATLTMVISFAELFTDAGFQKYVVQHEFKDDADKFLSINVAFWTNLALSMLFWGGIALFRDPISSAVGNPGLGYVIVIACVSIPLQSFSSIQMAIYQRNLDYKTLFKVRLVGILIPLVVTVPLAFIFRSFWALVIGTIAKDIVNAIILTLYSEWKPKLRYSLDKLKEMLSFSIWSMVEAISIWLTGYIDVFIVGSALNSHYLGMYKASSTTVGQIIGLITGITTPILFSALSRLQYNEEEFKYLFFKFQKSVGLLVLPISVGMFCYSDLITKILLGDQWLETSRFIGLWGLTSGFTVVFSHFSSEIYRAKGKPKLSVLAQWLHIVVLCPAILIAVKYGYEVLYLTRSIVRLELIAVNIVIMAVVVKISFKEMFLNVWPSILASIIMAGCAFGLLSLNNTLFYQLCSIIICAIVYCAVIWLNKDERMFIRKSLLPKLFHN